MHDVMNEQVIEEHIMAELNVLYEQAKEIGDEVWALSQWAKETKPIQEWAKYRVRVRWKTNSISIEWNRVIFVGPPGKRRPLSKYVRRGKGYAYRISTFGDAPDWELFSIGRFEGQFGPMRKRIERLVKMLKEIRAYSREKQAAIEREKLLEEEIE